LADGRALPGRDAALPLRPLAAKVGAGNDFPFFAVPVEKDAHPGRAEGVAHPQLLCGGLERLVGGPQARVGRHAQHALGGVVVRAQDGLPIGQLAPSRGLE
jgi:hypothetical protein